MMNMEVNGTDIKVKLYDNSSAKAVEELLKKGPFTLNMKDYAHMEKFGSFGMQLPANDEMITTEAGDVMVSKCPRMFIPFTPFCIFPPGDSKPQRAPWNCAPAFYVL